MHDINGGLISLLGAYVMGLALLPRRLRWIAFGVAIPAMVAMICLLLWDVLVPMSRGMDFAFNFGSALLCLTVCIVVIVRLSRAGPVPKADIPAA